MNCKSENAEQEAVSLIHSFAQKHIVKSKTINQAGIELKMEVRLKNGETALVNRVNEIQGITGATLVTFNGEYMS